MAQAGYTPIQLYYSSTTTNAPSAGNLASGELAINITDGKLFYKDNGGSVQVIAWKTTPTTAGGTGLTSWTAGDLPYYATGTTLSKLGIGTNGQILTSTGTAPQWSTLSGVAVTTFSAGTTGFTPSSPTSGAVTLGGTLATTNGGTGLTSFSANQVFYASSTSAIGQSANLTFDGTTLTANALTTTSTVTLNGGTANGVAYLNGSKVLTTGSALSFDGTTLVSGSSGTTTKLVLQGGVQTSMAIKSSTGTSGFLIGRGYASDDANSFFLYDLATSQNRFYIDTASNIFQYATAHVWNNAANSTEYMRLTSTGLGIGTSSPGEKLTVVGGGATSSTLNVTGGSAANDNATIASDYSLVFQVDANNNVGGRSFNWRYGGKGYSDGTELMVLNSSGNLGIGATSPTAGYRLHLAGSSGLVRLQRDDAYIQFANTANTDTAYIQQTASVFNIISQVNGAMVLGTNATERARITSGGDLLVGTTTAAEKITTNGNIATVTANNSSNVGFSFYANTTAKYIWQYQYTDNAVRLYDYAGGERLRITSGGDLLVNTATNTNTSKIFVLATATNAAFASQGATGDVANPSAIFGKFDNDTTTSQIFVRFTINNNGAGSGQITANGANTAAFGSYSDQRLKENIVDLPPQLANIMALRPVEFDYIQSEGGGHQIGFIAQNMEEVYPDVVGEREDGMKMIAGWSKTEARLVKAIQELKAELDSVKAELATLKGN